MRHLVIETGGALVHRDPVDLVATALNLVTLAELQRAVGGYVEPVSLQGNVCALVNADGPAMRLPANPCATRVVLAMGAAPVAIAPTGLVGAVAFVAMGRDEYESLSLDQVELVSRTHHRVLAAITRAVNAAGSSPRKDTRNA